MLDTLVTAPSVRAVLGNQANERRGFVAKWRNVCQHRPRQILLEKEKLLAPVLEVERAVTPLARLGFQEGTHRT